jgi:hypothetical protein
MPSGPGAYSGPQLILASQQGTPSTAWSDVKTKTAYDLVLANDGTAGSETYASAKIKTNQFNRYSYLRLSEDNTKTNLDSTTINGVAHCFGRLGQSKEMYPSATSAPFYWDTPVKASKPTVQVSLLPEFNAADWTDWTTTTQ